MRFDPGRQRGKILDLFAGAGGWDVGLGLLGLAALGIECDQSACATGTAAGHARLRRDVARLEPHDFAPVWGLIGSPPCQAYSTAGKQLGRLDKPLVIACAHEIAAGNDTRAARLSECHDQRSLLTVEPLRFAFALRPRWIALEQVPAVLGLWTLFAQLLDSLGYQSAVGILSAERYGVPQTRRRAFLIASLDGPVELPAPTHRSYNARRKELPDEERELAPWVSMAEALGWQPSERVGFARRDHERAGSPRRQRDLRPASRPAFALTEKARSWRREVNPIVQIRRGGDRAEEGFDPTAAPAQAVTPRVNRWQAQGVEPDERWAWQNGNQAGAAVRNASEPAPTIHFGHNANSVEWVPSAYDTRQSTRRRPIDAPAPTMLASGLAKGVPVWSGGRPATTIACDPRVSHPGAKRDASRPQALGRSEGSVRVTVSQAAILQGFPPDYPWRGSRTRQFEQVGNAVPPPLAHRVLEQAIRPSDTARRQRR